MLRILKKQQFIDNFDLLPESQRQHFIEQQVAPPKVNVSEIKDPLTGQDVSIVLLKKEVQHLSQYWTFEDQGSVDEENDALWLEV